MGKKLACVIAIVGIICLLLLCGYRYRQYENEQQQQQAMATQLETMHTVIDPYEKVSYGNKYIYDTALSNKSKEEIENILRKQLEGYANRMVTIHVGEETFSYGMEDFSASYYFRTSEGERFDDAGELASYIVGMQKDEDVETQYAIVSGTEEAKFLRVEVEHTYDASKIDNLCMTLYKLHYVMGTNASIQKNMSITSSTNGTMLNTEKLNKKLKKYMASLDEEPFEMTCKTSVLKPEWTTADLKKCKSVIGEFSTTFSAYGNRGNNVALGASRINGIFLYPGEQVSFDQLLHDNSDGKAFMEAPSYLNGQTVMTAGGGICQVSSTAYNAILRAGILPAKRFNHSMAVSYVPMGLDATISEGVKDLVLENTLDYPLFIESVTNGGTMRVRVYSNKAAKGDYMYQPRSVRLGQYRAAAYLDVYKAGKLKESIYLHTDTYLPHA